MPEPLLGAGVIGESGVAPLFACGRELAASPLRCFAAAELALAAARLPPDE